jgi:photosystem II stability/assembly factor-like uncharacterized protein
MGQASHRGWRLMALAIVVATGCGIWAAAPATASGPRARTAASGPGARATAHARVWFESMQMISAKVGWALLATSNPTAGRGAPLLPARTADGGRSWTTVAPPAIARLVGEPIVLHAATPSRAWLAVYLRVGSGQHTTEVFGTQNGGASWSRSAPIGRAEPIAVGFLDPERGWLLESLGAAMNQNWVEVYRTSDAGLHWSLTARTLPPPRTGVSSSGLPTACDKSGMIFSSPRTGWITGYCNAGSEVLVTHDAGGHWAPQSLPITAATCSPDGCAIDPPQFIGRTGFLTIGHYPATGELLVSQDAGRGWQPRHLPTGAGPYPQIRFFSADRGIAVSGGAQGLIGRVFYVTANGGQSWSPIRQGRRFGQVGTYLDFVSSTDGFAWISSLDITSGPAPDLYVTTNSGRTWTAITPRQA